MPFFDRFDIAEAWDVFSALYHGGQNSKLYQKRFRLVRMGYRARPDLDGNPYNLTDNGKAIFAGLVNKFAEGRFNE